MPKPTPTNVKPSAMMPHCTSDGRAPNAILMPISRVCSATVHASTPKMPNAVNDSAIAPNTPIMTAT